MKVQPGIKSAHPAAVAYATRLGMGADAFKSNGRLTVRFDDRYRVHIQPGASGRIAITARLLDLASLGDKKEEMLLRFSTLSTGLLRDHGAGLCIDPSDHTLQLQSQLGAEANVEQLQAELEDFVNALEFWTRTCASASSASPARAF